MDYTGQKIEKYLVKRLIGEGGMASVYEAEHEVLGIKAAIKVLKPIFSTNAQIRERFMNEAKMMASLQHANITKIIDFEESDSFLAIIMELLEGQDLNNLIKSGQKLSEKEIVAIFKQTLSAFEYAHGKGVVHRDIKPSNLFILPDGTVKILDFGIAKLLSQGNEMTQTGTQMGTPVYMSPEQVKADKSIDHRSDIYSLGVTMFYALSGKPPYDAQGTSQFDIFNKIVYEPLPELTGDSKLTAMVKKACQKDRDQRFQSCEEWQQALKHSVSTKLETYSSEKTIVEPILSDRTIFEENNVEKNGPGVEALKEQSGDDQNATDKTKIDVSTPSPNEKQPEQPNKNIIFLFVIGFITLIAILVQSGILEGAATANEESYEMGEEAMSESTDTEAPVVESTETYPEGTESTEAYPYPESGSNEGY